MTKYFTYENKIATFFCYFQKALPKYENDFQLPFYVTNINTHFSISNFFNTIRKHYSYLFVHLSYELNRITSSLRTFIFSPEAVFPIRQLHGTLVYFFDFNFKRRTLVGKIARFFLLAFPRFPFDSK